MASKPMRITDEAEAIALRYGATISKGIVEMEYKIAHPLLLTEPAKLIAATGTSFAVPELIAGMPPEYWKKLKAELELFLERAARGY